MVAASDSITDLDISAALEINPDLNFDLPDPDDDRQRRHRAAGIDLYRQLGCQRGYQFFLAPGRRRGGFDVFAAARTQPGAAARGFTKHGPGLPHQRRRQRP